MAAKKDALVIAPPVVRGPLTTARCSKFVRQRIAERLGEVCAALLDKAAAGDLAAVKALLLMAGLDKGDAKDTGGPVPLAKQLAFARKTVAALQVRP